MKRTPLYEEHVAAGARMVEFAGWQMPVQYASGVLAEHKAVRTAAGLFDVSHMGEIEIAGSGAEACCARLFTNDARALPPGKAHYSLIANDTGGLVDDIIVYRLEPQRFLVCVNASNAAVDFAWIAERQTGDCTVVDRSEATALIAIQGPAAAAVVERLAPAALQLKRFECAPIAIAGADAIMARTGYTGEDGFEVFLPVESAVSLWRALLEAGRDDGVIPCGLGARDTLRLEAALPLYGHELGPDVSPYEVRLGWAVKLNRPDMIGYEALSRAAAGEVRRRLIGLTIDGGIAREGTPVFAAGARNGAAADAAAGAAAGAGAQLGVVTSGTHSPTLGRAIAMALVEREHAAGPFEVEIRGKRRAASVTGLPFCVKRA
ncbi:MAG TPA: glycine cleavage system aminomethyltransferase GcvT [Candidatus Limnocylindrales bacterium]|nr:glycine cleavage system aminomethyltransferase GcvT [Candidatus Limnocylindrales bacterium]